MKYAIDDTNGKLHNDGRHVLCPKGKESINYCGTWCAMMEERWNGTCHSVILHCCKREIHIGSVEEGASATGEVISPAGAKR